jgi:hypothetical protein
MKLNITYTYVKKGSTTIQVPDSSSLGDKTRAARRAAESVAPRGAMVKVVEFTES